jgi:hypothetical protein
MTFVEEKVSVVVRFAALIRKAMEKRTAETMASTMSALMDEWVVGFSCGANAPLSTSHSGRNGVLRRAA